MNSFPEGNAIVYCDKAFNTPNGKTAHGLVRFTERYKILSIIDSNYAGKDAGEVLDNKPNSIPIYANFKEAYDAADNRKNKPTHFIIGLAPDGGRLPDSAKETIKSALKKGLNVDSGLHDFLSDNKEFKSLAANNGVIIRDIRKTPPREELHFFSGKIEEVKSYTIAILGTDSAIGKRTTAWILVHALRKEGYKAELIGTGQTAWMQGAKYSMVLDSLINDFVSGEIEHAVYSAWENEKPHFIILEGQGSLLNPAYPGGFELMAAGRPDVVIMQHAPARKEYDGFPDYPIHSVSKQIKAIEIISGKPVISITINHENMTNKEVEKVCNEYKELYGIPAFDVLLNGGDNLVKAILNHKNKKTVKA